MYRRPVTVSRGAAMRVNGKQREGRQRETTRGNRRQRGGTDAHRRQREEKHMQNKMGGNEKTKRGAKQNPNRMRSERIRYAKGRTVERIMIE